MIHTGEINALKRGAAVKRLLAQRNAAPLEADADQRRGTLKSALAIDKRCS